MNSQRDNVFFVTSFYKFFAIEPKKLESLKTTWLNFCASLQIKGLFILSPEGINGTLSGPDLENIKLFKSEISLKHGLTPEEFKDSTSDICPFRIMKVTLRAEACTLDIPNFEPKNHNPKYLTPLEWDHMLNSSSAVCVDVRNWYENRLGMFENAIDLKIDEFTEFGEAFKKQNIPNSKDIMIYCTGGIRCEKATADLQKQGYNNIYQLKNGILNYLQELPHRKFKGECFLFDERVAVDQNLLPTKRYKFCPHCGQPAELVQSCRRCDSEFKICGDCETKGNLNELCSKHCAYQFDRYPGRKGPQQVPSYKSDS
ncbi:MAG: rhodanese-like domain-containing protein [Pseudomonadota bacterium]|nr:rhodanese-like domain-containing protein [Pseudomonadota bacterium]